MDKVRTRLSDGHEGMLTSTQMALLIRLYDNPSIDREELESRLKGVMAEKSVRTVLHRMRKDGLIDVTEPFRKVGRRTAGRPRIGLRISRLGLELLRESLRRMGNLHTLLD